MNEKDVTENELTILFGLEAHSVLYSDDCKSLLEKGLIRKAFNGHVYLTKIGKQFIEAKHGNTRISL